MTTALSPDFWTLGTTALGVEIPAALPHQGPILDSPARFKLWRKGRRTGGSRCAFIAATTGHGPDGCYLGMLEGGDILWLAPDYPQSAAIWREEVRPRFAGVPGYTVHESHRRVTRDDGGSLEIRSAESIDNVRGRQFDGVICDEAAYMDLEYAWTAVLRPALADREGWAMFISSPNAGPDGNTAKRTPSYFNMLAQRTEAGSMPGWHAWHNKTDDNPVLSRAEVQAMRAEYPADSPTVQQEIDALLVAGGLMAFPELDRATHLVEPSAKLSPHWTLWGTFDWGYAHPFAFGLMAQVEDGRVIQIDSVHGRKLQPPGIVEKINGTLERWGLSVKDLPYVACGHDVWADYKARGETIPTLAEQFAALGMRCKKASISRVAGVQNCRRHLAKGFRLFDTAGNRHTFSVLQGLVTDPNNPEDVLKQDADQNGFGGDDPYDMWRYGLAERPIAAVKESSLAPKAEDRARPYDFGKKAFVPDPLFDGDMGRGARTHTRPVNIPRPRVAR